MKQQAAKMLLGLTTALSILGSVSFNAELKQINYIHAVAKTQVFMLTHPDGRGGTSFIVTSKEGKEYLLTNKHVCESPENFKTMIAENADLKIKEKVKIVRASKITDLCLLELPDSYESEDLHLKLTKVHRLGLKNRVAGHPDLLPFTVSFAGIITQFRINVFIEADCGYKRDYLVVLEDGCYTTLPKAFDISTYVIPGNSGSPVLDEDGSVIGIVSAHRPSDKSGIAIPTVDIIQFLNEK